MNWNLRKLASSATLALLIGALLALTPVACHSQEQAADASGALATSERWRDFQPLRPMLEGPEYHLIEGYDPVWMYRVREGVELARDYYGSFGPVHVHVLGKEDGTELSAAAREVFLRDYCSTRRGLGDAHFEDCMQRDGARLLDVLERGESEAFLSYLSALDPPQAELVFINNHLWHESDAVISDATVRGIHEYTHVFQSSLGPLPTWIMEGGAMFTEVWIPYREGLRDWGEVMLWSLDSARAATDAGLGIWDMEEIESAPAEVEEHYRGLAYDGGAWAMVFMVHRSAERRVCGLREVFYPAAKSAGWEAALCSFARVSSKQEFYAAFASFMELSEEDQLAVLSSLEQS